MIQDIITYMLIGASTGYVLFSLYRIVFPAKKHNALHCSECAGCGLKMQHKMDIKT
jgi:hypothetical protein